MNCWPSNDFVSIGAERWLEVIQDWTSYGKVISKNYSFPMISAHAFLFEFYKFLLSENFLLSHINILLWRKKHEYYFQDLHFIFYERLCDDPVSLRLQSIFVLPKIFLSNEIFILKKVGITKHSKHKSWLDLISLLNYY